MLTMILAAALNSAPVATAAWQATVAIETTTAVRADRHVKAERLGAWLNQLDGERIRAASVWTPFADAEMDAAYPFDEEK